MKIPWPKLHLMSEDGDYEANGYFLTKEEALEMWNIKKKILGINHDSYLIIEDGKIVDIERSDRIIKDMAEARLGMTWKMR